MYEIFELLLQKFNISAYKFCKETGISQSTISTWKAKRNLVGTELGRKIANYFGVSLDYLMTGKNEPDETKNPYNNIKGIYLSYAKEAQDKGIDPDDIRLALDTIERLRKGK